MSGAVSGSVSGEAAARAAERAAALRCFLLTAGVLAVVNVARSAGLLGPPWVSAAVVVVASVLLARRGRLGREDLGLAPSSAASGLRYGAAAFVLVLLVVVGAALLPPTRGFLEDTRAQVSGGHLLVELLVAVLLVTAVPEELAFRGVLLGSGTRVWRARTASLVTSALFGLWHVAPTLRTAAGNGAVAGTASSPGGMALLVLGAVAVTFVAGLVFCWLRLRSGSLLAPLLAHCATNGVALAVAWFVQR